VRAKVRTIYSLQCACGHFFEALDDVDIDNVACPLCGKTESIKLLTISEAEEVDEDKGEL
jgi:hypothetical protein